MKNLINLPIKNWSLIAAVNNDEILNNTLLHSPAIDGRCEIIIKRGYDNIGEAYNDGRAEAKNEIMVFAHQDVYLPEKWLYNLSQALDRLSVIDPNWGVLGVFGLDKSQEPMGFVYSNGFKEILGHQFQGAIETLSFDELLLVIRRSSELTFDDQLPGFHLYGTDICLKAESQGMKNYIIPAFCIHNSQAINSLPLNFWKCYFYMKKKWFAKLPLKTTCTVISSKWTHIIKAMVKTFIYELIKDTDKNYKINNPEEIYNTLKQRNPEYFDNF